MVPSDLSQVKPLHPPERRDSPFKAYHSLIVDTLKQMTSGEYSQSERFSITTNLNLITQ